MHEITNNPAPPEESKVQKRPPTQSIQKPAAQAESLKDVFASFTAGAKDMDGKVFQKLCKDCKVLSKACTTTDVDLIFA